MGGQATMDLEASVQGVRPVQLYDCSKDPKNLLKDKMRFNLGYGKISIK